MPQSATGGYIAPSRVVRKRKPKQPQMRLPATPAQGGRPMNAMRNSVLAPPVQRMGPSLSSMPARPRTEAMNRDSRIGMPKPALTTQPVNAPGQLNFRNNIPFIERSIRRGQDVIAEATQRAMNAAKDAAVRGVATGVPMAARGIAGARDMAADAGTAIGTAYGRAENAYNDYVNPPTGPPIQRVSPGIQMPPVQPEPLPPKYADYADSIGSARRAYSPVQAEMSQRPKLSVGDAMTPTGPRYLDNPFADQVGGHLIQDATPAVAPPAVAPPAMAPPAMAPPALGSVPASAGETNPNLPPEFAGLERQMEEGTLPFQVDLQQRQNEYTRRTAATPQRPGVNEEMQDRLRLKYGGPNFRSRSVMSEGLGDGRDFDRMREADAAAEADFVMPTVGNVMNRNFRMMDPDLADRVRAGDARRRERRGTPEPGTPEADQLFRAQRQRRRDRAEANRPIRQYRALMRNQQEVAPVLFGGQGTPYVNVARRFNQGPGLNQRTLAATRMVRGDRLQDEQLARDRFTEDRTFRADNRYRNRQQANLESRQLFEDRQQAFQREQAAETRRHNQKLEEMKSQGVLNDHTYKMAELEHKQELAEIAANSPAKQLEADAVRHAGEDATLARQPAQRAVQKHQQRVNEGGSTGRIDAARQIMQDPSMKDYEKAEALADLGLDRATLQADLRTDGNYGTSWYWWDGAEQVDRYNQYKKMFDEFDYDATYSGPTRTSL